MRSVVCIVLVHVAATGVVNADDGLPLDDLAVRGAGSLLHDPREPQLTLDIVPRPAAIGLGVVEDTDRTAIRLSNRARLTFTGTSLRGYADAVPMDGNEEDIARGTHIGVSFQYDAGWLQLDADASYNTLSSRFGPSGAFRDVSLRVSRSHRFSRWVTGWIGLSLGNRTWTDPPPGERNSSYLMLSIGGTFR